MKKTNILKTYMIAFGSLFMLSCSEIEHGVNDIDSWPDVVEVEAPDEFVHPGILHTTADIERMKEIVANQEQPAYKCYEEFANHEFSKSDYELGTVAKVISRKDGGNPRKYEKDFNAACQNAIMYAVTDKEEHAEKSAEILKEYANTLESIDPNGEPPLLAGIMGVKLAYAAEIIHYLCPEKLNDEDFAKVCAMFKKVFKPALDDFLEADPYSNGNWGASVGMSYIAIAVLTDDKEMYQKALDFYTMGNDNGNILNYIDGETGQCQESGRDQQHVQLGLECLAKTCEIAYKQGTDLYGVYDNKLLKGYEYTAKYNLGEDVPFKTWTDVTGKYNNWTEISKETKDKNNGVDTERGIFRPVFEMVYNHYYKRKGLSMPYTAAVIEQEFPNGEGYYYEHFGFGTFLFND